MSSSQAALVAKINEAGAYDGDIEAQLMKAVDEFKRTASW